MVAAESLHDWRETSSHLLTQLIHEQYQELPLSTNKRKELANYSLRSIKLPLFDSIESKSKLNENIRLGTRTCPHILEFEELNAQICTQDETNAEQNSILIL